MQHKRIAFLVNTVRELKPTQATTMLIHRCALLGHEVFVIGVSHLWLDDEGHVRGSGVHAKTGRTCQQLCAHLGIQPLSEVDLETFDLVWIRTNPARDPERAWAHQASLPMLSLCERPRVINDPLGLQRATSKLYLHHASPQFRPRTTIAQDPATLRAFIRDVGGPCVLKPLQGTHGRDVFMIRGEDADNLNQILDIMTRAGLVIAQEFIPEAVDGDVRILLVNGEILSINGSAAIVARVPGKGDFRSNINAGGVARAITLSDAMIEAVEDIKPRLVEDGIFFSGADFIGGKLVEINTFSPGGLLDSERFYEEDFTGEVIRRALLEPTA